MPAEAPPPAVPTLDLVGMQLCRLDGEQVVDHVGEALARGQGGWLLTATLDYLRRFSVDAADRALFSQADLAVADGMPLVWASRLQGQPLPERVAGSDLVWSLAERAARDGRSLYLLGGNPGAAERAAQRLQERWPALRIAGTASPQLSPHPTEAELAPLRRSLQEARPDLVYVGFGMPKQDRAIAALRDVLPGAWWVGVGISISFIAGEVVRAPRWMQRSGLEWLHRMLQEPRRLARRYLVDDLPFALRMFARCWSSRGAGPPVST